MFLSVKGLNVSFRGKMRPGAVRSCIHAVNDVSLSIDEGEVLGIVGESGSGKSTLGRSILRLIRSDSGSVYFDGHDVFSLRGKALQEIRGQMQMIFQDPYMSLHPKLTIGQTVEEPLKYHSKMNRMQRREKAMSALEEVGLDPERFDSYPGVFSGGQLQRVGIARALVLNPSFIVADEPLSALDLSVQAQIVNLFLDLRENRQLTIMFISHDLSVVRNLANRVGVMCGGQLIEIASTNTLFSAAKHPYTQMLIDSIPGSGHLLEMDIPVSTISKDGQSSQGCVFRDRCPHTMPECTNFKPTLQGDKHKVACHLYDCVARKQESAI